MYSVGLSNVLVNVEVIPYFYVFSKENYSPCSHSI